MAEAPVVHIGENSPEYIAYKLMEDVLHVEGGERDRHRILDTYAECLDAVRNPEKRL